MRPRTQEWFDACKLYYDIDGLKTLNGRYSHWCPTNAGIPVDETTLGFVMCRCFRCKCGELMKPKEYWIRKRPLEMFDDIFECPDSRFWNFWRHDWHNLGFNDRQRR